MPASQAAKPAAKRLRTPLFPQLETSECGAACLGIVLAHFGRWEPIEALRDACGVGRDGSSAADIVNAGKRYDLKISGWRKQVGELHDVRLPAILFWEFNHFLVLEGFRRGRYYLNDPANGRRTVDAETFDQAFTGIVLTAEPGPGFRTGGSPPSVIRKLWRWLREVKSPLAFVAACGLLLALPGLSLPVLLSMFVDYVMSGAEGSWGVFSCRRRGGHRRAGLPAHLAATACASQACYSPFCRPRRAHAFTSISGCPWNSLHIGSPAT